MTGTNHILTGVAIGLAIPQPAVAIPLALLSHFVLDALPHYGDDKRNARRFLTILTIDGLTISIILISLIATQSASWGLALVCGFVAASPDFMWLPNFLRDLSDHHTRKPYDNPITKFHKAIQWAEKPYNWPYEFIWAGAMLLTVAKLT